MIRTDGDMAVMTLMAGMELNDNNNYLHLRSIYIYVSTLSTTLMIVFRVAGKSNRC